MTKAWMAAGFKSEQVDIEGRKLVFRRVASAGEAARSRVDRAVIEDQSAPGKGHPLIGWMKGTVFIPPETDLTHPADPEWGDRAWGDKN